MPLEQPLSFLSGKRVLLRIDNVFFLLDHLRGYLRAAERFLESESAKVEEDIASLQSQRSEVTHYLVAQYDDALMALADFYPNILRKSIFVAIYSLAEVELNDTCHRIRERDNLPLSLEEIRGPDQSIERARKYLVKLAGMKFPDTAAWSEMINYKKLRNCIVHNQGTLISDRNAEYLRNQYIPHHPHLKIGEGLYGDEVILLKGFCEEVVETVDTFFQQLYGYKEF